MNFRKKQENDFGYETKHSSRSVRLMKRRKVDDTSELDEELKECGCLEDGLSKLQKEELLMAIAASKKSAGAEAQKSSSEIKPSNQINKVVHGDFNQIKCADTEVQKPSSDSKPSQQTKETIDKDTSELKVITFEEVECIPPSFPDFGSDSNTEVVLESPIYEDAEPTEMKEDSECESNIEDFSTVIESRKVKCKYKLEDINPLNVTEDVVNESCLKDKRKPGNQRAYTCGALVVTWPRSKGAFMKNLEKYYKQLRLLQRQSVDYLTWGGPVVVGRHFSNTLDMFHRGHRPDNIQNLADNEAPDSDATEESLPPVSLKENICTSSKKSSSLFELHVDPSDSKPGTSDTILNERNGISLGRHQKMKNLCFDLEASESGATSEEEFEKMLLDDKKARTWRIPKRKPMQGSSQLSENLTCNDAGLEDETKPCVVPQSRNCKSSHDDSSKTSSCSRLHSLENLPARKKFANKNLQDDLIVISDSENVSKDEQSTYRKGPDDSQATKPAVKVKRNKVGLGKAKSHQSQMLSSDDIVPQNSPYHFSPEDELPNLSTDVEGTLLRRPRLERPKHYSLRREIASLPTSSFYKRQRLHDDCDQPLGTKVSPLRALKESENSTGHSSSVESSAEQVHEHQNFEMVDQSESVACPMCNKLYAKSIIEVHASDCQGVSTDDSEELFHARTPKNKQRCYICRGVFQENAYKDHVQQCIRRGKVNGQHDTTIVPSTSSDSLDANPVADDLKHERKILEESEFFDSRNSLFNYIGESNSHGTTMAAACNSMPDEVHNRLELRTRLQDMDSSTNLNFSMNHMSTPPLSTFQPISQQKNALIDFKNQFVVKDTKKRRHTGGPPKHRAGKKRRIKIGKSRKRKAK